MKLDRLAAAARSAQTKWAKSSWKIRSKAIASFARIVSKNKNRLAEILTKETGKPITQSKAEIGALSGRIRYFLDHARPLLEGKTPFQDAAMTERISVEPLGLIANISAWNYPYFVGSNVFIPALLTGNAVLYKPSEFAQKTGLKIAKALHEAGVPKDVFIPILGDGSVGAELINRPLDGIFFTGSYATGVKIAETAAKRLTRVQLELGGKDPAYAAEDCNPEKAAASLADGAFYNAGQSCCAVERIYVHKNIYSRFLKAFVETVKGFRIGDPMNPETYLGPLTRPQQIAVLEAQVKDAVSKGAKLLLGGGRASDLKGNYFLPTILTDCDHRMTVMKDESFGPIIGIMQVSNDTEAVRLMKDTPYGLTAGVYSRSRLRAEGILAQIDAGSSYWNCCDRVSPRLPWSGRGHSGIGSTLSEYGITAFLKPRAWHLRAKL